MVRAIRLRKRYVHRIWLRTGPERTSGISPHGNNHTQIDGMRISGHQQEVSGSQCGVPRGPRKERNQINHQKIETNYSLISSPAGRWSIWCFRGNRVSSKSTDLTEDLHINPPGTGPWWIPRISSLARPNPPPQGSPPHRQPSTVKQSRLP